MNSNIITYPSMITHNWVDTYETLVTRTSPCGTFASLHCVAVIVCPVICNFDVQHLRCVVTKLNRDWETVVNTNNYLL